MFVIILLSLVLAGSYQRDLKWNTLVLTPENLYKKH